MRAACLALLVLIALGPAGCSSTPPRTDGEARGERLVRLDERAQRAIAGGDAGRAALYYREALRLAESVEDFHAIGVYALNLAGTWHALGEIESAQAMLDRVLALHAHVEGPLLAEAAGRKALIAIQSGQLDAAEQWLVQAEQGCTAPACRIRLALDSLRGQLLLERGAAAEARAAMARVIATAQAEGDGEEEANALRVDGRAAAQLGDHAQAVAALSRALDLDRRLALPRKIALDLIALAEVELARGERIAARDYAQRALSVSRAAGSKPQWEAAQRLLEKIP